MSKKVRLAVTISQELFDTIDLFSRSLGNTKSETVEQIMGAAAPTLESLAKVNFQAQTMTKSEIEALTKRLEKVSVNAERASRKAGLSIVELTEPTPI